MKALVTGVCGFTGAALARHLTQAGDTVTGVDLPGASTARLKESGVALEPSPIDLSDAAAVKARVAADAPEVIYHLAALSGSQGLEEMLLANVVCTANVLEAAAAGGPTPRVLLVSSAGVYGTVAVDEQPIREDRPLRPRGPYALSKAAMELLGWDYMERCGVPVVVARTFNLLGSGAPEERLVGTVQRQLAEIAAGKRAAVLELGDLSARRDYIWVDEAAMAYRRIALAGAVGEAYNVCSGVPRSMGEVVDELIALSGLAAVTVRRDEARVRTGEIDVSVGDPSKLRGLG